MATNIGSEIDDLLSGTPSNDVIQGSGGSDTLDGGSGNDSIDGRKGKDTIFGSSGEDTIAGGGGADTIDGGSGPDTLTGNGGADTFVFTHIGGAVDTITDFRSNDKIELAALAGLGVTAANQDQFIEAVHVAGNAALRVDVDGSGAGAGFVDVVPLYGFIGSSLDIVIDGTTVSIPVSVAPEIGYRKSVT